MLKETETKETIGFFVTFLLLMTLQSGGSGSLAPCPPPGYAYRSKLVSIHMVLGPRYLVQVCACYIYLFLSWWVSLNNFLWSNILYYGHEVMRLVDMKTAEKTFFDLMTDHTYYFTTLIKIYLLSLVAVTGEKVDLNERDNYRRCWL